VQQLPRSPDLVIGADLAYFTEELPLLMSAMKMLAPMLAVIAVQHRDGYGARFAASAAADGWEIEKPATYCCQRCSVFVLRWPSS